MHWPPTATACCMPSAVSEALDVLPPVQLGELGYSLCIQIGDRLGKAENTRAEAVSYYDRAASIAQQLARFTKARKTLLYARAASRAGRAVTEIGDRASGLKRINEALALLPEEPVPGDPDAAAARAEVLADLASALAEAGRAGDAQTRQKEAVTILRRLAASATEHSQWLGEALLRLGDVQRAAGRHAQAAATLEEALACSEALRESQEAKPFATPLVAEASASLVQALRSAGRKRKADTLLGKMVEQRALDQAARVGHDGARSILRVTERAGSRGMVPASPTRSNRPSG